LVACFVYKAYFICDENYLKRGYWRQLQDKRFSEKKWGLLVDGGKKSLGKVVVIDIIQGGLRTVF